jgi:hypothetical protein
MELQETLLAIKKQSQGSYLFLGKNTLEDFKLALFDNLFADKNAIHFDFVQAESEKIEDVRRALHKMSQKPLYGLKVFFLPNFSNLARVVQNTLLKSLEEVRLGEVYILQAGSSQGILPTILSRCQKIDLKNIAKDSERPFFIDRKISFADWWENKPKTLVELRELLFSWTNFNQFKNHKQQEIVAKNYIIVKKVNVNIDLFWVNLYAKLNLN